MSRWRAPKRMRRLARKYRGMKPCQSPEERVDRLIAGELTYRHRRDRAD